jgi:hypothetical protein
MQHELGQEECVYSRLLLGKPEGKRPSGVPRRKSVDNIKMNVRFGWSGMDWINLTRNGD